MVREKAAYKPSMRDEAVKAKAGKDWGVISDSGPWVGQVASDKVIRTVLLHDLARRRRVLKRRILQPASGHRGTRWAKIRTQIAAIFSK